MRPTLPAPLDFTCLEEQVLLVIGIGRLRICRAEPNCCLSELSQPSPVRSCPLGSFAAHLAHACFVNSLGDPRYRFSWDANHSTATGCFVRTLETSDAQHTVRQVSSRTWLLSLRTCSTTHNCQSVPGGDAVVPVLSRDAQYSVRASFDLLPHHVCHTLRRTIVAHCTSKHEVPPESVLGVSIASSFSSHP